MKRRANIVLIVMGVLLLVELLYVDVISSDWPTDAGPRRLMTFRVGCPFRSVEYTTADLDDVLHLGHPERDEWEAGVKIKRELLACDALAALLLALLLSMLLPRRVLSSLLLAGTVGVAAGATFIVFDWMSRSFDSRILFAAVLVVAFVPVPIVGYAISLQHVRAKTIVVVGATVGGLACLRTWCAVEAILHGGVLTLEPEERLPMLAFVVAYIATLVVVCLVMGFLLKRLLPRLGRSKPVAVPTPAEVSPCMPHAHISGDSKRPFSRKGIVLCVVLLATVLYVGHHFVGVRKVRDHALSLDSRFDIDHLILEKVWERAKADDPGLSRVSMDRIGGSFHDGFNPLWQQESLVNHEDVYRVTVEKHILVPWIRINVLKIGSASDTDE